ncbi:MAG: YdhR family protein [Sphingomonadales bacterium]|nr:YdhR family protein [Sphingomonadales bacterium]
MATIVQINFDYDVSEDELEQRSNPERARIFQSVEGLCWKVWLRDADRRESGGIYLFETRASAQAYVDGPIAAAVCKLPDSSNHSIKIFDVRENVSAVTGAPLGHRMPRG